MSSLTRYANLVRHVRNWPLYFADKFSSGRRDEYRFISRRRGHPMFVPGALMGTFKELFMSDVYPLPDVCARFSDDPIIFDVGANIGLFSVAVQEYCASVHVHAFEPLPSNFEYLQRNLPSTQPNGSTSSLHACAVVGTESAGEMTLHFNASPVYSPSASLLDSFEDANVDSVTVKTITLKDALASSGITRIDLLKLDCEGSEYDILYSAGTELLGRVQQILMETHDIDTDTKCTDAMIAFLEDAGYAVNRYPSGGNTSLLWARRDEDATS